MNYSLGNTLSRGGSLNPDGLSLDLQFATDKTLTARKGPTPTFTRASTATFIGSNGLIQSAAINAARFDHDPVTLACKGLLIEESRTNLITGSNACNTWTLSNSTVAASSVVTPEGTADAWKLVEGILLDIHSATRSFTPVSGTTYTASVWLKSAENGFAFVGLSGGGFTATFVSVDLSTGAVSTAVGTPVGATSVSYLNGWFRVSFSLAATGSSSSTIGIRLSRDGIWANRTYLGNGVNGVYCYGAQVEAGAFPTSYIPTTTASVVRSADVCSITGSAFTGFTKLGEGSVVVHGDSYQGTTPAFCQFSNDTNGSRSFNFQRNSSTGALEHSDSSAGVMTISASPSFPVKFGVVRRQSTGLRLFYNGVAGASSAFTTNGVQTRMLIGNSGIGLPLNGCIRSIKHFKKRLSDAKMQTLTAP
jgi:hypothetical protein